ncbi:ArnT family glycosyltransferase [Agrilactobacillus fermenti]|uniref:ArnT family glycosyltransferase n=1 Tax=Agrilactobacillus fermenti TaxID=2586909 RepID=UPI003A5C27B2
MDKIRTTMGSLLTLLVVFFSACMIWAVSTMLKLAPTSQAQTLANFSQRETWLLAGVFIVGWGLFALLVTYLPDKKGIWLLLIGLILLLGIGLRLYWIYKVPSQRFSDFKTLYRDSVYFSQGDRSFNDDNYLLSYPYQNGFIMYQSLLIRIFGPSPLALKLVNVFMASLTMLALFGIVHRLFNKRVAALVMLAFATFLPNIFMITVLTNQYASLAFNLIGLYLFIAKNHKWSWLLCSGFFLALGNTLRPVGALILLAVGLGYLCFLLRKRTFWRGLIGMVCIMIGYFGMISAVNGYIRHTGLSEYPMGNRNATWKFVTGLNSQSKGRYVGPLAGVLDEYPIGPKRDAVGKKLIKQELKDKQKVKRLFIDKYQLMWGDYDESIDWSLTPNVRISDQHRRFLAQAMWGQWVALILSMTIGALALFWAKLRRKLPYHNKIFIFELLFVGYVLIHFAIEIQTRYRFFITPEITTFAMLGIWFLIQLIFKRDSEALSGIKEDQTFMKQAPIYDPRAWRKFY